MWKFYVGSILLLIVVLAGAAAIQIQSAKPVVRPAQSFSPAPSQDDNAMSNMRIP